MLTYRKYKIHKRRTALQGMKVEQTNMCNHLEETRGRRNELDVKTLLLTSFTKKCIYVILTTTWHVIPLAGQPSSYSTAILTTTSIVRFIHVRPAPLPIFISASPLGILPDPVSFSFDVIVTNPNVVTVAEKIFQKILVLSFRSNVYQV